MQLYYLILYTSMHPNQFACLFLELGRILVTSFSNTVPIGVFSLFLACVLGNTSLPKRSLWLESSCPPILSSIGQPMYSREHGAAASERLQLGTPPPLLAARLVPPRNLMGSSIGYHTSVSSPTPLVPGKLCYRRPPTSLLFCTISWPACEMTWHPDLLSQIPLKLLGSFFFFFPVIWFVPSGC